MGIGRACAMAAMTPPLAVPSSLLNTKPVTPSASSKILTWETAFWPVLASVSYTHLDVYKRQAKGGVIAAIAQARPIPIRFIGVGESIDDLRPFNAHEFIDAMFE